MTEEEAKKKWCPMTREVRAGLNRNNLHHECIASKCMMWRWDKESKGDISLYGHCGLGGNE